MTDEALIEKMARASWEAAYKSFRSKWEDLNHSIKLECFAECAAVLALLRAEDRLAEEEEVTVPMEPTEEMLSTVRILGIHDDVLKAIYASMLAARPRKPVSEGDKNDK